MAEAISLAKSLNDMHGLAVTLSFAASLAWRDRNLVEVERSGGGGFRLPLC
jgi:hypothetical protein